MTTDTFTIRDLSDIEAIEQVPLAKRVTDQNTYAAIAKVPKSTQRPSPSAF